MKTALTISAYFIFNSIAWTQSIVEVTYGDPLIMHDTSCEFYRSKFVLNDSLPDAVYLVYDKNRPKNKKAISEADIFSNPKLRDKSHLRCKAQYVGGKIQGTAIYYSYASKEDKSSTNQKTIIMFSEGKLNGPWSIYEGGKLVRNGWFENGHRDSIWKTFDGRILIRSEVYSSDTLIQLDTWYGPNQKDRSWSLRNRKFQEWHSNGNLRAEVLFGDSGAVDVKLYNEDGTLDQKQTQAYIPLEIRETYRKKGINLNEMVGVSK